MPDLTILDRQRKGLATKTEVQALVAEIERLRAECERHRRANLVRTVVSGWDEAVDGSLTDYINESGWDAVPWRIAQTHIDRAHAARGSEEGA